MLRTIKEIKGVLPVANNNQRNWDLSKPIPDEHLHFCLRNSYSGHQEQPGVFVKWQQNQGIRSDGHLLHALTTENQILLQQHQNLEAHFLWN